MKDLFDIAESRNVSITKVFANSLFSHLESFMSSIMISDDWEIIYRPQIEAITQTVKGLTKDLSVIKVKAYNPEGITIYSTELKQIGEDKSRNPGFMGAINGKVVSQLTHRGEIDSFEGVIENIDVLSSYIPMRKGEEGEIKAVFELYYNVTPLIEKIKRTQALIVAGVTMALGTLYVFLFFIVRHADRVMKRQHEQRFKAEDELRKINEELENRVSERTVALANINDKLISKIQEQDRTETALAEQAIRDPLTGLYNRRYFNERIEDEIERSKRNGKNLGIILCDLDHFKTINDTKGHQFGDKILKMMARCIMDSTRGIDLVFRWGGDEIVVVFSNTTIEGVQIAARRILKGIDHVKKESNTSVGLSMGIALFPNHGKTVDDLVRQADQALYIAKKRGGKIQIGEGEFKIDENSLKVVFQPIMDLQTKQVIGFEALSRDAGGRHEITDLFKKYQLIGKLNEVKLVCFNSQLKEAERLGIKRVFLNVNFSILQSLGSIQKPSGMEVILEISESEALHHLENVLEIARNWRSRGYKIALDDFGAGFISLPFISQLIPSYIKIDRSILLQAVSSEKFMKFSRSLIKALETYSAEGIIAEGIENEKELQLVKRLGILMGQGYLLGRPKSLVSLKEFST